MRNREESDIGAPKWYDYEDLVRYIPLRPKKCKTY
jgi:hypothetical protein